MQDTTEAKHASGLQDMSGDQEDNSKANLILLIDIRALQKHQQAVICVVYPCRLGAALQGLLQQPLISCTNTI